VEEERERERVSSSQHTLITLLILLPASSRIAFMPSHDAFVLSAMLPSTRFPFLSAGIWPETKMWLPTWTAWLCF
jgi:hypothetical protein